MKTRKLRRHLKRLLRDFALRDWRVDLVCIPDSVLNNDGNLGEVTSNGAKRLAWIRLATRRRKREVLETLAHEVVHLAMRELTDWAEDHTERGKEHERADDTVTCRLARGIMRGRKR